MLYYNRIDVFAGNDVIKAVGSKKCIICNYSYF